MRARYRLNSPVIQRALTSTAVPIGLLWIYWRGSK